MQTRLGIASIGLLALTLAGCPQPVDNEPENEGGSGGSSAGSGGSSGGSGGMAAGGAGGSSNGSGGASGGSGGSAGGSGGSGGMAAGGSGGMAAGGMGGAMGGMGGGMADAGMPPAALSWEDDVHPIFMKYCSMCHAMQWAQPDSAYTRLMGNAGGMCDGPRMTAGNGADSLVVKKMLGTAGCGARMPLVNGNNPCNGEACVTMEEVQKIIDWINQGAKQE